MDYFEYNNSLLLGDIALTVDDVLLIPSYGEITSREEVIEHNVLYTAPMDTVTDIDIYEKALKNNVIPVLARPYLDNFLSTIGKEYIEVGIYVGHQNPFEGFLSVGTSTYDIEKLHQFLKSNTNHQLKTLNISIDIAHGFSSLGIRQIQELQLLGNDDDMNVNIMCGSIATSEAALELYDYGVRIFRVGIGGGQVCTTRLMTGCGVPNLYAIFDVYNTLKIQNGLDVRIIGDGGIKDPGTCAKYLAAGADAVMIGTAFSGCVDSPASIINGKKVQRGQASYEFQMEYYGKVRNSCAEGISTSIPIDIEFKDKVKWFYGGLRSATSYLGLTSIKEINPHNVKFIRCSPSAVKENNPICMM